MKNIITKVVSVLLAGAVLAGGTCCLGFASRGSNGEWFGNFQNIAGWHWGDNVGGGDIGDNTGTDKPVNGDVTVSGKSVMTDTYSEYMLLDTAMIASEEYADYGIDAQADSAYSVVVSVLPESTTDKTVTCVATFVNPESAWAKGKKVSDYITVTGSNPFNITCKQAFGEKIRLTYTAASNPACTATSEIDYIKAATSVNVSLNTGKLTFKSSGTTSHTVTLNTVWGVGTIEPTITVTGGQIVPTGEKFSIFAEDDPYEDGEPVYFASQYTYTGATINVGTPYAMFFKSGDVNHINSSVAQKAAGTNDAVLYANYSITYAAANYTKTGNTHSSIGFDVSGIIVRANVLTPDKTHIYFGG